MVRSATPVPRGGLADAPGRRLPSPALLLVLVLVSPLPVGADERPQAPALVRCDAGLDRLARAAARSLEDVRDEVASRLGWTYGGPPVEILIVRDLDRMAAEAGGEVPAWAVAVAIASRARIVVRADLLALGFGTSLAAVLRHEWVHLSWDWRAGMRRRLLPLWAEEGLAEQVGGGVSVDAGATLDVAAAFGHLLVFEDLRTAFPAEATDAGLAYRQSSSWVGFVARRAGWGALRMVLEELASGEAVRLAAGRDPFPEAIRRHTGLSISEWHSLWRQSIEEDARPWFHLLFRDLTGFLLGCLAILAAGAFFAVVARRRKDVAALPDEPLRGPDDGSGPPPEGRGGE